MPKSSKKRHDRRRKTVWASRNKLLSCQSTLDNIINGFEAANVTGKQHNTQLSTSLLLPSNFNYSKMYRCVDESCLTSVLGQESAVIGRGSFGTCVIKIFSGIPVVVKQIHRRTLKQRHTLQEAHLLQLCSGHPNLAYLYGVCTPSGSHPQLVTAFYSVAGKPLTLSAGCYKLNLSDVQIANIMLGILDGLSHIHSRNILHNDIKGNNIVLSDCANLLPSIRPIIIDFNKAAPFKAAKMYKLTEEDKVIYRKRFTQLAPDLIDGLVKQSTATDVYSFGVMAEELIGCTQKVPMMTRCTTYYSNDRPTISTIIIRIKEYLLDK